MKKQLLFIIMLLINIQLFAQNKSFRKGNMEINVSQSETNRSSVKSITPIKWTIDIPETHTTTTNTKEEGAAVGGTAGWLMFGGPVAIIGGALVGSQVADKPKTTTYTTHTYKQMSGYTILLKNGESFRTTEIYKIGQLVDIDKVKIE